jgi:hypothetical protein
MGIKFLFAAMIRWFLHRYCYHSRCGKLCGQHQNNDRERVNLTWPILWRKVAPTGQLMFFEIYCKIKMYNLGVTASLDISLSNWSLQYITISLYSK